MQKVINIAKENSGCKEQRNVYSCVCIPTTYIHGMSLHFVLLKKIELMLTLVEILILLVNMFLEK